MKKRFLSTAAVIFFSASLIAQSNVGIGTNNPKSKLDIDGSISLREGAALALVNGNNDNIALTGNYSFYRISGPTAAFSILGLVPPSGADGQMLTLVNTTSQVMTIKNNASGTPANSISTLTGGDFESIAGNSSITLQYNKTAQRWFVTANQNYKVSAANLVTKDIVPGTGSAVTVVNGANQVIGGGNVVLDVTTNALNQKGIVPGPTGLNANQAWVTDGSGNPAWAQLPNANLQNSSVTINTGTGLSGGGNVALGGTLNLVNTAPDQTVSITGAGINSVSGTYPNFTVTGTEVDGSVSNEGALTVGAGTASTSLINSNTSGSTPVTLQAGSNVSLTESGNTITIASSNPGGTVTQVNTGTGLTGGPITSSGTISMANVGTAGTYTKVTTNAQGQVISGTTLSAGDVPNLAGDVSGPINATVVADDSHNHTELEAKPQYTWSASTNPRDFPQAISASFVRAADGWPEYGSVVNIGTYPNDGGTLQLYAPYAPAYGGNSLRYRLGVYNNAGWTGWKTIWDDTNDGTGSGMNADLLDGYTASDFALASGNNNYIQNQYGGAQSANFWISGTGRIGTYGAITDAPTTYGSIGLAGAKNGYYGVLLGQSTSHANLMFDGGGNGGTYYQNWGWSQYYLTGSRHMQFNTSSDLGHSVGVSGNLRATAGQFLDYVTNGTLCVGGGSIGNTDAVIYAENQSNNDWGLILNKGGYDYGQDIRLGSGASYAFRVLGSGSEYFRIRGDGVSFQPFIYDLNNTGYYLDPNSASQMSSVYANNWFRPQGNTGVYWQDWGRGFYMSDGTWVRTYNAGSFYSDQTIQGRYVNWGDNNTGTHSGYLSGYMEAWSVSDGNRILPMNYDYGSVGYGYLGQSNRDWYYVYADYHTNTSRRETKKDITPLDNGLYEYVMADIDKIKPTFYRYKGETKDFVEGYETKYKPQLTLGVMLDESPDYIQDNAFSGVNIYSAAVLALTGVKYNRSKIQEMETVIQRNNEEFGSAQSGQWVAFDASFKQQCGSNKPFVTITPTSEHDGSYYISEVSETGFKVTASKNFSFNWQAIAPKQNAQRTEPAGQISASILSELKVTDEQKKKLQDYFAKENAESTKTYEKNLAVWKETMPDLYERTVRENEKNKALYLKYKD